MEEACRDTANRLGKALSTRNYDTKGCYLDGSTVYYGTGGSDAQIRGSINPPKYRPVGYDCTNTGTSIQEYKSRILNHHNYNKIRLHFKIGPAVTADGKKCEIPFKYEKNGPEYSKCTEVGANSGTWCATSVNNDLTYDDWDWC